MTELIPTDYRAFLDALKDRVRTARLHAAQAANRELIALYWSIGRDIQARQAEQGWGAGVIDRLSRDLRREFPDMKGLSARNLGYMKAFAAAWPDPEFLQQPAAKLPWFHHCVILAKVSAAEQRSYYVSEALAQGWSRNQLTASIESRLHERQGGAVTNFDRTLPRPTSDLARQTLKDPYIFDFLGLAAEAEERDIELAMVAHIRDTLVELGSGFAYMGRQRRLEVAGEEFFLDMLFYHARLHCYVVVELKGGKFKPEHAGKLNFYLSAVDDLIADKDRDGPSIGLLLCRSKNRVLAEYALRDINKPIGVADLHLTRLLPEGLEQALPTVEILEAELSNMIEFKGDEE